MRSIATLAVLALAACFPGPLEVDATSKSDSEVSEIVDSAVAETTASTLPDATSDSVADTTVEDTQADTDIAVDDIDSSGPCHAMADCAHVADACHAGACGADGICTRVPLTSGSCDDGDLCTRDDVCADGTCAGQAYGMRRRPDVHLAGV